MLIAYDGPLDLGQHTDIKAKRICSLNQYFLTGILSFADHIETVDDERFECFSVFVELFDFLLDIVIQLFTKFVSIDLLQCAESPVEEGFIQGIDDADTISRGFVTITGA